MPRAQQRQADLSVGIEIRVESDLSLARGHKCDPWRRQRVVWRQKQIELEAATGVWGAVGPSDKSFDNIVTILVTTHENGRPELRVEKREEALMLARIGVD